MANEVKKVNTIAITDIKNINAITDTNLKELNLLEFTGIVDFTWSTGGVYPSGLQSHGGAGTQLAALSVGGHDGTNYLASCGEYTGPATSTWSQVGVGSMSGVRAVSAVGGSQTSGITVGGQDASAAVDTVETYGGSSWSSEAAFTQDTSALNGCGAGTSNTSFLVAGGDGYPGGAPLDVTEVFNGSTWSDSATMDNATHYMMTFGASDDCFVVGGYGYPSQHNYVQHLSSGSFSVLSATLVSHSRQQAGCFGTTSSGLIVGGAGKHLSGDSWGDIATSEQWNGTAWALEDVYPGGTCDNTQGTGFRASGTGGGLMWGGAPASGNTDYTGEYG